MHTIQTYQGGLSCCHHGPSLLDTNQDIPWPDEYLEYRFKFRFYFFKRYTPGTRNAAPASHKHLTRVYWATVRPLRGNTTFHKYAPLNASRSMRVHMISSKFSVRVKRFGRMTWMIKKGHQTHLCRSSLPCSLMSLSMELYNADTGELLCHVEPIHGLSGELYDETGFLSPFHLVCWGSPDEGLVEPKFLSLDTTLLEY